MSRLDYSKWDNIELSDDEDIEVHPNIDKASFIRWKQRDIHQKREERKARIAMLRQETDTNNALLARINALIDDLAKDGSSSATDFFQKVTAYNEQMLEKKNAAPDGQFNEFHSDHPLSVDEIFVMVLSKVTKETGLLTIDDYKSKLATVLAAEIPKINDRQKVVAETIAKEEHEQNKKLTSENICREKFDKTDSPKKKGKTTTSIEVLNPESASKHQSAIKSSPHAKNADEADVDLRELDAEEETMLNRFAKCKSFEEAYRFIQENSAIASKTMSDHLMARALRLQMEQKSDEALRNLRWSLALGYGMKMGPDGIGMFFRKIIQGTRAAEDMFEVDVQNTWNRLQERSEVLRKNRAEKNSDLDESNSNLTPEQAAVFRTFPKYFQEALFANDMEKINEAFSRMGDDLAAEVMEKCQKTGLITVLSEEEAQNMIKEDEQKHQYRFNVEMTCSGCSGAVERVLKRMPGVEKIEISLENQTVDVAVHGLSQEEILQAIQKTGKAVKPLQ